MTEPICVTAAQTILDYLLTATAYWTLRGFGCAVGVIMAVTAWWCLFQLTLGTFRSVRKAWGWFRITTGRGGTL